MKLKLNEKDELELVYSFRTMIYFENIQGKTIDFEPGKFTTNDLLVLFYCVFITSLQKAKKPIIPMTDFLDIIDLNNGEQSLIEFANWFTDIMTSQNDLANSLSDEEKKDASQAKKK